MYIHMPYLGNLNEFNIKFFRCRFQYFILTFILPILFHLKKIRVI